MNVSFFSPKYKCSGYGSSAIKLKKYLAKEGIVLDEECDYHEIGLVYHLPQYLDKINSRIKILFTMIESTRIPRAWIPYMQQADIIVAPSVFVQRVFERQLKRPVELVPLGIDPDDFYFLDRPRDRKPFTFLHYDSFSKRKGWWELFNGWQLAFGNDPNFRLICKTAEMGFVPPLLNYPNIKPIRKRYSLQQMRDMIQEVDAFVFPSWGEGFGMTPLEAMATGIPAIVTKDSGIGTYFDSEYMRALETIRYPASYDHISERPLGDFHPATKESIAKELHHIVDNYDYYYQRRKEISAWVQRNWSYAQTAKRLAEVIDKACRKAYRVKKPVISAGYQKPVFVMQNPLSKETDHTLADHRNRNGVKIAVATTSGMGNNILALPAIKAVRKQYPNAQIDIYTWQRSHEAFSLLMDKIGIDNIYLDNINPLEHYDIYIELLTDGRYRDLITPQTKSVSVYQKDFEWKHELEVNNDLVRQLGAKAEPELPFLVGLTNRQSDFYICHVGHSHDQPFWKFKFWGADNYASLFAKIEREFGLHPILVGTDKDLPEINAINYDKKMVLLNQPLPRLIDTMRRARFFIGNDSGIMHLSSLLRLPTFGIFTFTSDIKNHPWGENSRWITPDVPCYPCYKRPRDKACDGIKHCLANLTVDKVWDWLYENRSLFS